MKITPTLRFLLVVMCLCMVFSLFACGEDTTTVTDAPSTDAPTEESTENKTEAPTSEKTEAPTSEKTEAPTSEQPTEAPTSGEDESTPAEHKHTPEKIDAVAPTCTTPGATEGKKCSECGAILVEPDAIDAKGHNMSGIKYTEYAEADDNQLAMVAGACPDCGEKISKPAGFMVSLETMYADVTADNVTLFEAVAHMNQGIGNMIVFDKSQAKYPADGLKPIRLDSQTGFAGLMGIRGWIAYLDAVKTDKIVFKVVDQDGKELVGWTDPTNALDAMLPPRNDRNDVTAAMPDMYLEGPAAAYGYTVIIDVEPLLGVVGEKTVDIVFAAVNDHGYIPFVTLDDVIMPKGCEHKNQSAATPAVDATCTTAGNPEYTQCTDCGAYIVAGAAQFAVPTIPALGHDMVVDAAVEPTCEEDGLTEGSHCSRCDEATTPQKTILTNGHAWEWIGYKAPTVTDEGNPDYAVCSACGKFLVDDEVADAAPVIPVIVPNTNYFYSASELNLTNGAGKESVYGIKFASKTLSEDRTYIRYERTAAGSDGYITFFNDATITAVSGQYIVIKYRTNAETSIQFAFNTLGGLDGNAMKSVSIKTDEEWHILALDLTAVIPSHVKADEATGTYSLKWARLDILDATVNENFEGRYIDIAYVAIADEIADFESIMQDGDADICEHSLITNVQWSADDECYTAVCTCGNITKDMLHITESYSKGTVGSSGNFLTTSVEEEGLETFVRYQPTAAAGDPYYYIYMDGSAVTGKYMVIKYRLVNNNTNLTITSGYAGSVPSGYSGAKGGVDAIGTIGSIIGDGEWHYFIYKFPENVVPETEKSLKSMVNNADGTFSLKYLRLTTKFAAFDGSCYLDIAELAFADCQAACDAYIKNNTPGLTEGNPIYFEFGEEEANATIKVPAGATYYFAGRVGGMNMILNGANVTVAHNGQTVSAENGVVAIANCSGDYMMPGIFAITNNSDADATYTVSFTYPVGSSKNPVDAVIGENKITLEAGTDGYYFEFVATQTGTLTLTFPEGANWFYAVNNVTSGIYGDWMYSDSASNVETLVVYKGNKIVIQVNTYNPDEPWSAPAGEVSFTLAFAASEGPVVLKNNSVVLVPEAGVTYQSYFAGTVMTVYGEGEFTVVVGDQTYTPDEWGTVKIPVTGTRVEPFTFTVTGDVELTFTFAYPEGHIENPVEIDTFSPTVIEIAEGSQGYHFSYNAWEAGVLTLTFEGENGWMYIINNLSTYVYGDPVTSANGEATVSVEVGAWEKLQIVVNTFNAENAFVAPAGTVTVTATFTPATAE